MFDYINPGFYILSGILVFLGSLGFILDYGRSLREKKVHKTSRFVIFIFAVAITMPLFTSYNTKATIDENIEYFKNNAVLECGAGSSSYLVSKKSAWEIIKKDRFVKDDLLIRADRCKPI